jgi:hypothetical protein
MIDGMKNLSTIIFHCGEYDYGVDDGLNVVKKKECCFFVEHPLGKHLGCEHNRFSHCESEEAKKDVISNHKKKGVWYE